MEERKTVSGSGISARGKPDDPSPDPLHDAFMELIQSKYSFYIQKSYGYLKCLSLAEDAVQDGILSAYTNLNSVRDKDALAAWVSRIITNKAIDSLRKNKRLPQFEGDLDAVLSLNKYGLLNEPLWSEISDPERDILREENLEKLKSVIKGLTDVYRIPLLLKDFDDLSIKEISEILGISESNVKVRIHRARIKVKQALGEYFYPQYAETS